MNPEDYQFRNLPELTITDIHRNRSGSLSVTFKDHYGTERVAWRRSDGKIFAGQAKSDDVIRRGTEYFTLSFKREASANNYAHEECYSYPTLKQCLSVVEHFGLKSFQIEYSQGEL